MKKLFLVLACAFAVALYSCKENTLTKEYNKESLQEDMQNIVAEGNVDSADVGYMSMIIVKASITGEKLEGMTYNDILNSARDLKEHHAKMKERGEM